MRTRAVGRANKCSHETAFCFAGILSLVDAPHRVPRMGSSGLEAPSYYRYMRMQDLDLHART